MGSVGVRTAAGGVLSLPTTPADVIGRCDRCRRTYREGDWYCDHLAAQIGHPIAWLSDQPGRDHGPAAESHESAAPEHQAAEPMFLPTFLSPEWTASR